MKYTLVIPARHASTRLPRKLLLEATGRPLICHTVECALRAADAAPERIVSVLVATDHDGIAAAVRDGGFDGRVQAVLTDPAHPSGSDRVAEAVASCPASVEGVINLQGDEPEIEPAAILALADRLDEGRAPMATLAYPIHASVDIADPNRVKLVLDRHGCALYFSRAPIPFDRDGTGAAVRVSPGDAPALGLGHVGMYAYRRETLAEFVRLPEGVLERIERLEQLRALENGIAIAVHVLPHAPPKGIDTPEDYAAFVHRFTNGGQG